MRVRTVIIWSILHCPHCLGPDEISEAELSVILSALFPGITYSTTNAFDALIRTRVKPVLEKLFPDLLEASENDVPGDEEVMISPFLTMAQDRQWDDPVTSEEFYQRLYDIK